jgi:hypothetical protein
VWHKRTPPVMSIPRNDDHPPPKLDFQVVALVRTPEIEAHPP